MIKQENLQPIVGPSRKRLGRGYGSGKGGHTSSRGQKGQKSRSKVGLLFTGTKTKKSYVKRLPLWRGKGRFKPDSLVEIDLDWLEKNTRKGDLVDKKYLLEKGLLDKNTKNIKIKVLSRGKITKSLKINLPTTAKAEKEIKKAGGEIIKD
jgi:Ribosomal protein L15